MIEQLSQMQTRIQTMRDAVLKEGSVMPSEHYRITIPKVRRGVLSDLDCLAAAVAEAHRHMSTVEHYDFLSATDKEEKQKQIVRRLHQDLRWLIELVHELRLHNDSNLEKVYVDYMEAKTNESQPLLNECTCGAESKRRQCVYEAHGQLAMVKNEVDNMLQMLDADVR